MIRVKKETKKNCLMSMDTLKYRKSGIILISAILMCGTATSVYAAAISNSATATGNFDPGTPSDASDDTPATSNTATKSVDLPPKDDQLVMLTEIKSGPSITEGNGNYTDIGDTIVYKITLSNPGNVTQTAIALSNGVVKVGLNSTTATGSNGGLTHIGGSGDIGDAAASPPVAPEIGPGEDLIYEVTYTFSKADSQLAAGIPDGVFFEPSVTSTQKTVAIKDDVTTTVDAYAKLTITKAAEAQDSDGTVVTIAEAGGTIKYDYTVTNEGNVPIANVAIEDTHQGTLWTGADVPKGEALVTAAIGNSTDATGGDGKIDLLDIGSTATFTKTIAVTQDDIDDQS